MTSKTQTDDPANRPTDPASRDAASAAIPSQSLNDSDAGQPAMPPERDDRGPDMTAPNSGGGEAYAPAGNPESPERDAIPGITEIPDGATSEDIEGMGGLPEGPDQVNQQIV